MAACTVFCPCQESKVLQYAQQRLKWNLMMKMVHNDFVVLLITNVPMILRTNFQYSYSHVKS